jgi:hypothetical protein
MKRERMANDVSVKIHHRFRWGCARRVPITFAANRSQD